MDIKWAVVVHKSMHQGRVVALDMDDAWTPSNPTGWTDQGITAGGAILGWHDGEAEAAAALAKWEECDAPVKGTYCYAHNHAAW